MGLLEIVICTYDRAPDLVDCLKSLRAQNDTRVDWSILIVNNYSRPLQETAKQELKSFPNARIVQEPTAGLSRARNLGIRESKAEWLGFLDDDASVPPNFITKALDLINEGRFDCFGGHIRSSWKYGRPRWLPEYFGTKPILRAERGELLDDYNWGSNIFIKREELIDIGGFPEDVGLRGEHLGYSAENVVQDKLRAKGKIIGYDPQLVIDHTVMPAKHRIWWHIKSAYATGRDGRQIFRDQYNFYGMMKSLKDCFVRPVKQVWPLISQSEYYWENFVLDIGKTWGLMLGKIRSLIA